MNGIARPAKHAGTSHCSSVVVHSAANGTARRGQLRPSDHHAEAGLLREQPSLPHHFVAAGFQHHRIDGIVDAAPAVGAA
jgi:hypothetical protein